MAHDRWQLGFKVAVSVKARNASARQESLPAGRGAIYYYAERNEEGKLFVQPLGAKHHPGGEKRFITLEKFLEHFKPEPLFYYNHVKPAADAVQAGLAKGDAHLEQQQWDKAERAFKRVLETDEENIRGIFGLGLAYLGAGKQVEATHVFETLMRLNLAFEQEHKHLFNRFGIAMRKAGMFEQALTYYTKAQALYPGDEHLLFNLARLHYEAGEHDKARVHLEAALAMRDDFREARMLLGALEGVEADAFDFPEEPRLSPTEEALLRYPGLDLDGAPWLDERA